MLRTMIAACWLVLFFAEAHGGDKPKQTSASPLDQYKALVEQYEQGGSSREFAGKFLQLASRYPKDPVVVDALLWVVVNVRTGAELAEASEALSKYHIKSEKLGPVCRRLVRKPSLYRENLMRSLLKKSPHQSVKAQACFYLAEYLKRQRTLIKPLKEDPGQAKRFDQYYGKGFSKHLLSLNEAELSKEIEGLYEQVLKSFADVRTTDGTMGETAKKELFAIRHLSLGRTAPEITGADIGGRPFKLSDYRGKVVVLDFWGHW